MQITIKLLQHPSGQIGLATESPLPPAQTIAALAQVITSLAAQIPAPAPEPKIELATGEKAQRVLGIPVANGHQ